MKHAPGVAAEGEEVEEEELLRREVAKDPWEERLKPITADDKTVGGMPAWVLRSYNCEDNLIDQRTGQKTINHGTVVVKSLWWPG